MPREGDATAALGNAPTERLIADLAASSTRQAPASPRRHRVLLRRRDDMAAVAAASRGSPRRCRSMARSRGRASTGHRTPPCWGSTRARQSGQRLAPRRRVRPHGGRPDPRDAGVRGRRPRLLQRHRPPLRRRDRHGGLPTRCSTGSALTSSDDRRRPSRTGIGRRTRSPGRSVLRSFVGRAAGGIDLRAQGASMNLGRLSGRGGR